MKRFVFALLIVQLLAWVGLLLLLSACSASLLPTVPVTTTATEIATTLAPTSKGVVASPSPPLVTITGNVNVRGNDGAVVGWLVRGEIVAAVCDGQWCAVVVGQHAGYKFWRGCSDDNPAGLGCLEAE